MLLTQAFLSECEEKDEIKRGQFRPNTAPVLTTTFVLSSKDVCFRWRRRLLQNVIAAVRSDCVNVTTVQFRNCPTTLGVYPPGLGFPTRLGPIAELNSRPADSYQR